MLFRSRIIARSNYNAHTEPLFKNLEILPLPFLIQFSNLQIMQRYIQRFLPFMFNSVWVNNEERRRPTSQDQVRMILRNSANLSVPFTTLTSLSKFPLYNLPKTWLEFSDENIKILRNKIEFKHKLKSHYLDRLSAQFQCNRLICYACHRVNLN